VPLEWPLPSLVEKKASRLSLDEKGQLLYLLQAMLVFELSQRLSAKEVLGQPWLCEASACEGLSFMEET